LWKGESILVKAILIKPTASTATLELAEINAPSIGPRDVRLRVRAASVNRADLLARAGAHGPATSSGPAIAGLDAAGEVVEVGSQVDTVKAGDRVMAMVAGGLAEEVVLPVEMAIEVPRAWSWVEGAAAVLGLMTEHNALTSAGRCNEARQCLCTLLPVESEPRQSSSRASWAPPESSGPPGQRDQRRRSPSSGWTTWS
jgi:NADPH:quinone reductase-like Zn-dependent oxidoreductase